MKTHETATTVRGQRVRVPIPDDRHQILDGLSYRGLEREETDAPPQAWRDAIATAEQFEADGHDVRIYLRPGGVTVRVLRSP